MPPARESRVMRKFRVPEVSEGYRFTWLNGALSSVRVWMPGYAPAKLIALSPPIVADCHVNGRQAERERDSVPIITILLEHPAISSDAGTLEQS